MSKVTAPQGRFEGDKFWFPARIYYEDTDAGGVVFYANYLKFSERARTEFLRAIGVTQQEALLTDNPCGFMVRKVEADYLKPAVLDDLLSIGVEIVKVGGASAEILQEIRRGDDLLAVIKTVVVYVSFKSKRPVRIPENMLTVRPEE